MEEDWPAARRQERLREIQEPVEALVRTARATKRDAAVSTWVKRMQALADEVLETAKQIIEDQSTDYTLDEVDEELDMLSKRGQQVRELLETGKKDGFGGHPEFEQVQRAVLGEIQAQVTGAETWLE
jgi:vacuolar-type H+-ATPase subunit H